MSKVTQLKRGWIRVEKRVLSRTFRAIFKDEPISNVQKAEELLKRVEEILAEYGDRLPKSDSRRFQGIAGRPKAGKLPVGIYEEEVCFVANWMCEGRLVRERFSFFREKRRLALRKAIRARRTGAFLERRRLSSLAKELHNRILGVFKEYSSIARIRTERESLRCP